VNHCKFASAVIPFAGQTYKLSLGAQRPDGAIGLQSQSIELSCHIDLRENLDDHFTYQVYQH
jgi:hypothetical protein